MLMCHHKYLLAFALVAWSACSAIGCSSPPVDRQAESGWQIEEEQACEDETSVGLPPNEVFIADEACVIDHSFEEQRGVGRSHLHYAEHFRPECSEATEDPHRQWELMGYIGEVLFDIVDNSDTPECPYFGRFTCDDGHDFYLRFPRLSETWHRFEVRRHLDPKPSHRSGCNFDMWAYWKHEVGDFVLVVQFRNDSHHSGRGLSRADVHRIRIFSKTCSKPDPDEVRRAAHLFAEVDVVAEALPDGDLVVFSGLEGDVNAEGAEGLDTTWIEFESNVPPAQCSLRE